MNPNRNGNEPMEQDIQTVVEVIDQLESILLPDVEEDENPQVTLIVEINRYPLEEQIAATIQTAAKLNHLVDAGLWAGASSNGGLLTTDLEHASESWDVPVSQLREELQHPDELEQYYENALDATDVDSDDVSVTSFDKQKVMDNFEDLKELIDKDLFIEHGLSDEDEIEEFFQSVLDDIIDLGSSFHSDNTNVIYTSVDSFDWEREQVVLIAKISAYCLGHNGARCGVHNGDFVLVDDVSMYTERNNINYEKLINNSWSKKEAKMALN